MKEKILFYFHDGGMTGATLSLFRLLKHSAILDIYDVHIYVPDQSSYLYEKLSKFQCTIHSFPRLEGKKNKIYELIVFYYYITKMIFNIKPAFIYANTILSFDIILLSKAIGYKTILHVHEGRNILNYFKFRVKLLGWLSDLIIFVSNSSYENFNKIVTVINKSKVISNGVEVINNDDTNKGVNNEIINLSIIGTINENKSQFKVIKVINSIITAQKSREIILNIYGSTKDNEYLNKMMMFIKENNLEKNIIFHGEESNIDKIYNNTDIVIVASKDESFGLVTIEAMSYGIPVISSNNEGSLDIIKDNFNGLIFNYNDFNRIIMLVNKLIFNPIEYNNIREKGFFSVREKYLLKNIVSDWEYELITQSEN
ncbi:glycosyltransferase family 4 protein [Photobacterium leiognathi]|uniref:glycosyltransferase family 4 protein n=1 Tax=Photobacterium leiognathi TaxID=553611 RepID=UPI003AF352F7